MAGIRVVTLNLGGATEPLQARLEAAATGLAALNADVILLQEVRQTDCLPNTARTLAGMLSGTLLEYGVEYACATAAPAGSFGPGSAAGEEGLAILSRHPLSDVKSVELPDARPTERRILFSARVSLHGTSVVCHTTHLHWRVSDGVARERQVMTIDEELRKSPDDLHVLGGDFNAAPDTDEIRFLVGKHTLNGRRGDYRDGFARVNPGVRGETWARRNPSNVVHEWLELDRRIDYLFVSPEKRAGRGRVHDCRLVLDSPDVRGTWPSDHFGVMADVAL